MPQFNGNSHNYIILGNYASVDNKCAFNEYLIIYTLISLLEEILDEIYSKYLFYMS